MTKNGGKNIEEKLGKETRREKEDREGGKKEGRKG